MVWFFYTGTLAAHVGKGRKAYTGVRVLNFMLFGIEQLKASYITGNIDVHGDIFVPHLGKYMQVLKFI